MTHKPSLAHRTEERRLNKIREAVASVVGVEDAAHLWDWYLIETEEWNAEVPTVTPSQRTDPRTKRRMSKAVTTPIAFSSSPSTTSAGVFTSAILLCPIDWRRRI